MWFHENGLVRYKVSHQVRAKTYYHPSQWNKIWILKQEIVTNGQEDDWRKVPEPNGFISPSSSPPWPKRTGQQSAHTHKESSSGNNLLLHKNTIVCQWTYALPHPSVVDSMPLCGNSASISTLPNGGGDNSGVGCWPRQFYWIWVQRTEKMSSRLNYVLHWISRIQNIDHIKWGFPCLFTSFLINSIFIPKAPFGSYILVEEMVNQSEAHLL